MYILVYSNRDKNVYSNRDKGLVPLSNREITRVGTLINVPRSASHGFRAPVEDRRCSLPTVCTAPIDPFFLDRVDGNAYEMRSCGTTTKQRLSQRGTRTFVSKGRKVALPGDFSRRP